MSKILKGIGGAVKNIFKGVKKVFKKVVGSKLGKIALAALVVYTGGVGFGLWGQQGVFSGMHGAFLPGGAAAGAGPGVAEGVIGAQTPAQVQTALQAAGAPGLAGGIAAETAAAGGGLGAAISRQAPAQIQTALQAGGIAPAPPTGGGVFSRLVKGYQDLAPMTQYAVTSAGLGGLGGAFTPDQPTDIDILREQARLRRERYAPLADLYARAPGGILQDIEGFQGLEDFNLGAPPENNLLTNVSGARPWHIRSGR
ncbi:MAG: hypothetical protein COA71_14430 [SAR86 cluster bacterium]|uniref:Uncharacterized protein n=1 Tax=SAR86 cluster bacterium TaxID=2030880 RepID=A0A2A5C5W5_9GAMM|nr:MAG: hypothetical protein COA71_14430 [SAR86 cluster bacterium]